MILLAIALCGPALAADPVPASAEPFGLPPQPAPVPVLVSAFQAGDKSAAGLGALIEAQLAAAIGDQSRIRVRRVEDAPPFADYDARVYADSCPAGDAVPCAFVLAGRTESRYAVAGSVLTLAAGSRVRVSILDVAEAREAVSFTYDLAEGDDGKFADAVVKVLLAVMDGKIGKVDDIRDANADGEEADASTLTDDELAAQLAELAPQLAEAKDVASRPPQSIAKMTYTKEDLAVGPEEGVKPWESAGLTPGAWLRYKNSGLPLYQWKKRAMGHQYQLIGRVDGGWWRGPLDSLYYNRHAYDANLQVVDTYTAQAAGARGVPVGGAELAFGLLPGLDVGAAIAWAPGRMTADIATDGVGAGESTPTVVYPSGLLFGPRVEATFLPAGNLHPAVGVGATLIGTPRVDHYVDVPSYAAIFPSSTLVYVEVWPGIQARLSNVIDVYARVPIDLLVAGQPVQEDRQTYTATLTPTTPTSDVSLAVGGQVGLQVRLFGKKPSTSMDDEP